MLCKLLFERLQLCFYACFEIFILNISSDLGAGSRIKFKVNVSKIRKKNFSCNLKYG